MAKLVNDESGIGFAITPLHTDIVNDNSYISYSYEIFDRQGSVFSSRPGDNRRILFSEFHSLVNLLSEAIKNSSDVTFSSSKSDFTFSFCPSIEEIIFSVSIEKHSVFTHRLPCELFSSVQFFAKTERVVAFVEQLAAELDLNTYPHPKSELNPDTYQLLIGDAYYRMATSSDPQYIDSQMKKVEFYFQKLKKSL